MGYGSIRNTVESVAAVVGNYVLPGSGLITSNLVSKGAQQQLGSTFGQLAMLGSGIGGGAQGNLQNWGAGAQSLGIDTSGISNFAGQGVSDTFGLGQNSQLQTGLPSWAGGNSVASGNLPTGIGTFGPVQPGATGGMPAGVGASGPSPVGYTPPTTVGVAPGYNPTPGVMPTGTPNWGAPAPAANPMGWGSPMNLMQMGSGVYGIAQGNKANAIAQQQINAANAQRAGVPMPTSQNITQMPGYEAGLEAVQRSMAAQGYQGSGNMMAALQQYGTNAYQTAMQNYQNQQQIANQTAGGGISAMSGANTAIGGGLGNIIQGTALAQYGRPTSWAG